MAILALGGLHACKSSSDVNTTTSAADTRPVLLINVAMAQSGSPDLSTEAMHALHKFIQSEMPHPGRLRVFTAFHADPTHTVDAASGGEALTACSQIPPDPVADAFLKVALDIKSSVAQFGGRIDPADGKRKDALVTYRILASCRLASDPGEELARRNGTALQQRDVIERVLPTGERRYHWRFRPQQL
jgi:hypothetical protein